MGTSVNLSQADDDAVAPKEDDHKTKSETPELDDKKVTDKILHKIKHPSIYHADNVFYAAKSSPYGIEIVLKKGSEYQSVPADLTLLADGFGKVDLKSDDIFAVRIYNNTSRKVGMALTIDGINIFAFSKVPYWRELGKVVVPPGEHIIKGWNETEDYSHEFQITNYADSAAAEFGATEGVGTVTATFYEGITARGGEFGVGLGDRTEMSYGNVPFGFGKVVSTVSLKYLRPAHPDDLPPAG
jgi:hypothetical protein